MFSFTFNIAFSMEKVDHSVGGFSFADFSSNEAKSTFSDILTKFFCHTPLPKLNVRSLILGIMVAIAAFARSVTSGGVSLSLS
jgi:hypothetical protein